MHALTISDDAQISQKDMANAIRALSMDAVQKANSGHPGMPMGMADTAAVLWSNVLKHNPEFPGWPDRDRFVLSAGHGSMLLYSLMYLTGYADITLDEIKNFRQLNARTAGHPEFGHAEGIETTTGPLGQGIANAVGMAMAESMMAARFGEDLVDHYTYAVVGDGCLMEGISHEAASMAGHLKLSKLIVLFDDNGISIDGPTDLTVSDDQCARFDACGWHTQAIDGHDPVAVLEALHQARTSNRPSFIACKTTIGFGAPNKAGTSGSHGSPLGEDEIAGTRKAIGWSHAPFEIPDDILTAWRASTEASKGAYEAWSKRYEEFAENDPAKAAEFERMISGDLPENLAKAIDSAKMELAATQPKEATRKSSQNALEIIAREVPNMVGGSADLTGSNNTLVGDQQGIARGNFKGSYIYYGVREHAMASAMNGIALHGGFIPYGGTFLVFSDYCRSSIRLSALMKQRAIYVMTHDSIGLGEDGPTHQPVEHVSSLRAIPNLYVFRPADAIETLESWAWAVSEKNAPSLLALSRQGLPAVRLEHTKDNLVSRGGYILKEASATPKAVLLATGSEVHLALEAQEQLEKDGIPTRVVSMPCSELFDEQTDAYQNEVLGADSVVKLAVEAGIRMSWDKYIGRRGLFVGMNSFGASAPAPELYKHFGITTDAIVTAIKGAV